MQMNAYHLHSVQLLQPKDRHLIHGPCSRVLQREPLLSPHCLRLKYTSHMRQPSISVTPRCEVWRTLIVFNHMQLNCVSWT
ncbi:hypothetical protein TNCT_459011 [Trichonephila clavata]|uniref:Uncharacterized protein n=1 Tax=Trichonephila clavata TaxID=2740835 RepID=A0A8X6HSV8_TRICU|nr:hypothetical protein TNCT_459011 [Trichonephila clavata]